MAYTTPTTQTSGALITASTWNGDLVENIKYLKGSPVFDGNPTVGDGSNTRTLTVKGTATGTGGGAQVAVNVGATAALNLGNESNVLGTAYSDVGYVYGGTGLKFGTGGSTRVTIPSGGGVTVETVAPATPVAATLYKDSLVSAWCAVTFSGGTPSISDDVNVASLTDNGTGDTTVTYATAIGASSYAAVASPRSNSNRQHASCYSFASGSVRVYTYNDAADIAADADFSMVAVGA